MAFALGARRRGSSPNRHIGRTSLAAGLFAAVFASASSASARPGTHPVVVPTWDARASSVALQYRRGFVDGGSVDVVSYHANFSATSGKQSSQFGLYYVSLAEPGLPTVYGLAGSATALFNLPVAQRFDNGLPLAAIDFYVGSAPTALVSGERNYLTIPLVLGFGVPITPHKVISITPWFEISPSINLDTVIHSYDFSNEDPTKYINPRTGEIQLTSDDVERVLSESVDLEMTGAIGARGGVDLALHASDAFDFDLSATMSSLGTAFAGRRVIYLGGGFTWRWDEIVPAVLPAEKRLLHESCDDVETRFKSCPNSRRWKSPEELQQSYGPTTIAPSGDTQAVPPSSTATPSASPSSAPPRSSPAPAPPAAAAVPSTSPVPAPTGPANTPAAPSDGAPAANAPNNGGTGAFPVAP